MTFIECECCSTEFRVVSDTDTEVEFCPFCGNNVEVPSEEDEDFEEDLDYDQD